ncbi:DUF488 family protein [Paracoccus saliphilus]|uniref:DUF488 family protein n=1 Tax=Paracoccus saliphilus TaxID=405559 RepID=A0ABY7SEB1_9RHOB|nr:DUF488 family protein [Paracoccus saliphilus]
MQLKRAYESAAAGDGLRILVDRLWPRRLRKQDAALDDWMKEIAPSTELRKWFGHDSERWPDFRRRYRAELRQHERQIDHIRQLARTRRVTLVYSAHDETRNNAVVLKEVLLGKTGVNR